MELIIDLQKCKTKVDQFDVITMDNGMECYIRNKSQELYQFLKDHDINICLLSETWLKNDTSIRHSEFYIYRNDRKHSKGVGVVIIIKKNIPHQLLPVINTKLIENIGIKIFTNNYINIYSCYFSGNSRSRRGLASSVSAY